MIREPQTPVANYYPAVIDPQTFQRVQSLRDGARSPMRGKNATKEVSNVFGGGMARCGRCGGSLIRTYKGKGSKGGAYLVCSAAKAGAGCKYETANYNHIEDAFIADLPRLIAQGLQAVSTRHSTERLSSYRMQSKPQMMHWSGCWTAWQRRALLLSKDA